MNSYQKLKQRIAELEANVVELNNCIIELSCRPESFKSEQISAAVKLSIDAEKTFILGGRDMGDLSLMDTKIKSLITASNDNKYLQK